MLIAVKPYFYLVSADVKSLSDNPGNLFLIGLVVIWNDNVHKVFAEPAVEVEIVKTHGGIVFLQGISQGFTQPSKLLIIIRRVSM